MEAVEDENKQDEDRRDESRQDEKLEEKKGTSSGMAVFRNFEEGVPTVEKPFGKALLEVARERPEIVGLTADLAKYTDIDLFAEDFPERYFQVGMAEQNLVGITAGLARAGKVPFATSYCSFVARRAYDFIAIAIAEGRLNAKIIAALPGLTTSYGATHQGIEDLALMRAIPNLTIVDPCGATEIEQMVPAIAEYERPVYMRTLRGRVKRVLDADAYDFELGKAQRLREGSDVALVSAGIMTDRALQAAEELSEEGIEASVVHVSTVKPLDTETILQAAREAGAVVTMENHTLVGGVGTAITDAMMQEGLSVPVRKIGLPDEFMECGSVPYLTYKHGVSTEHAVEAAKEIHARKKGHAQMQDA